LKFGICYLEFPFILLHLFKPFEQSRRIFSIAERLVAEGCETYGFFDILKFKKMGKKIRSQVEHWA